MDRQITKGAWRILNVFRVPATKFKLKVTDDSWAVKGGNIWGDEEPLH
jgi:hypothetical protein